MSLDKPLRHSTYFFTCLTPDDFTRQQETLQLNGLNLKSSFLYSTFIILSVVVVVLVCVCVGGGGGLLFFRIHVKGVISFFCDAGGGAGHFV
jgi:hypothetical protein